MPFRNACVHAYNTGLFIQNFIEQCRVLDVRKYYSAEIKQKNEATYNNREEE
jgi:hypothetical protein